MASLIQRLKQSIWPSKRSSHQVNYKSNSTAIAAPGTQILYDPSLVPRLKQDHAQLIRIFNSLTVAIKLQKYAEAQDLLDAFKALFNAHALTEYTKLYIFLDYAFRSDPTHHELIIQFRKEMHDIGRAVRAFYTKWSSQSPENLSSTIFKTEIEIIGNILIERIETEESRLYEIYEMAPNILELGHYPKIAN